MQKIEEGRGFESDLWKIHSVRSVSTCKLFWHNSQQTIVVNNFFKYLKSSQSQTGKEFDLRMLKFLSEEG